MNQIESGLKSAMCKAVSQAFDLEYSEEQVVIEIPKDKSHACTWKSLYASVQGSDPAQLGKTPFMDIIRTFP